VAVRTRPRLRVLGPGDLREVQLLIARDPITHVFLDHRLRLTRLEPRWLGGEVWGYDDGSSAGLVSLCHAAANLTPAFCTPAALTVFAERALEQGRRCGSLMGPHDEVMALWDLLSPAWSPARSVRPNQPFLTLRDAPQVESSPDVRLVRADELDILYPACVAMYTEELGVSPEAHGGAALYRARVAQMIARGHALAHIEGDDVVFKAEFGAATPHAVQIQSVWIEPSRRGSGQAAAYVAAVCGHALANLAPVVTLYVNEHNEPARRAYARVGFAERCRFATVLF
jgi:predicted GNAT family acetyltransferase